MRRTKCLTKRCTCPGDWSRGLCKPCYNSLAYLCRTGKTTWAKLVKEGRALPAHRTKAYEQVVGRK